MPDVPAITRPAQLRSIHLQIVNTQDALACAERVIWEAATCWHDGDVAGALERLNTIATIGDVCNGDIHALSASLTPGRHR